MGRFADFFRHFGSRSLVVCGMLLGLGVDVVAEGPGESTISQRIRPRAVAVSPENRWIATADRIAGTVTIVSLDKGQVQQRIGVGTEPLDLVWRNEQELLVAVHRDRQLQRLVQVGDRWELQQAIPLSGCPVQVAFRQRAGTLLVSQQHPDAVLEIAADSGKIRRQFRCGNLPRYLLLDPTESWFAVTCELPGEVWCYDLKEGTLLSRQEIHGTAFNLGQPAVIAENQLVLPVTVNRDFPVTAENMARGWVVNNRLVRLNVPEGIARDQRQMNLDQRGQGMADLTGLFFDQARQSLIVLVSGGHELCFLDLQKLNWPTGDPDDFAPQHLRERPGTLRKLFVGGRPIDLAFLNRQEVIIANELDDSLQKIDLNFAQVTASWPLSDSPHESLIAEGERLFYDGSRSKDGWLSCHTCHYDGHTSGQVFDTLNDGTYDTKKLTLSLHHVSETEPWTWHGWQPDLTESMEKSLRDTMHGAQPVTRHAANALTAFSETLRPLAPAPPPSDAEQLKSLQAGKELFFGRAGCAVCHEPPQMTSNLRFAVGRVETESIFQVFNPPTLLGVATRRRFLHHGRAKSLQEVLEFYHRPAETSGAVLNATELQQIVRYLQSL